VVWWGQLRARWFMLLSFRRRGVASGGTAPSLASTCATAIGLMIGSLARTFTAKFVVIVIV